MALLEQKMRTDSQNSAASTAANHAKRNEDLISKIFSFKFEPGPGRKDILNFTNQLSVMVRAGISLPDAIGAIAAQVKKDKFRKVLNRLKTDIEGGQSFSQALSEHPQVFNNLYINMISAAEVSGSMGSMLEQLCSYLDQEAETRSQVRSAMVYPVIIAVMAVSATIFLLTFVLPRFTAIFAGKEHLLPAPTKIIMGLSFVLRTYWYYIIPAVCAAIFAFWYFINTDVGREIWDKAKLKIPLMSTLCRSLYITRSLHTMGVLINAGVPILDTIGITAHISGNIHYRRMWMRVHGSVKEGKRIATTLHASPLMPNSVSQMISSGEESGTLAEVLSDVSRFYERELRAVIKMVTSMIEPIMIVIMGFVVGFIAMSIILPIFKMSSVVAS